MKGAINLGGFMAFILLYSTFLSSVPPRGEESKVASKNMDFAFKMMDFDANVQVQRWNEPHGTC